jgi:hypothetical protein
VIRIHSQKNGKPSNLKVFGNKKTKEPQQDSQRKPKSHNRIAKENQRATTG